MNAGAELAAAVVTAVESRSVSKLRDLARRIEEIAAYTEADNEVLREQLRSEMTEAVAYVKKSA